MPVPKIKPATTLEEALKYFHYAQKGQKLPKNHSRDKIYYTKQFTQNPDLLLGAYVGQKLTGVLLGGLEENQILIGEFFINATRRRQGIGSNMLKIMETNALKHNIRHLYLGADPSAEKFYLKNNYQPELFVEMSGNKSKVMMDDLVKLYPSTPIVWREDRPEVSKIIFKTNTINNKMRNDIKKLFPKANIVFLFTKDL